MPDGVPEWQVPSCPKTCPTQEQMSMRFSIEAGRDFQPKQVGKIREANKQMNDGVLRSDDPLDPLYGQDLQAPPKGPFKPGEYPSVPNNQAQVDHIIPQIGPDGQPLGTNTYSNAQVVSALWNSMKSNGLPPR